jgi:DNA repair protein RadC
MVQYELKRLQTEFPAVKIVSIKDAEQVIRQFYGDDIEIFESCFILLLNNNNLTIGYAKISQGGITGTVVDTRLVAKYAIESLATAVILAHNHPSGNLNPSDADRKITKKIREGLDIFDIRLLDSMIITKDGCSSVEN